MIAEAPARAALSRARRATRLQFLLLGIVVGTWGTHIPTVTARYTLSEATLSVVLFAVAGGVVLALLIAGPIVGRLGARTTVASTGLAMGLALGAVLEYGGFAVLLLGMVVFGAAMSLFDVAINTEGSELESLGARPIMSNLHGMFSVGGMVGAAVTFLLLDLRVAPRTQLFALGAAVAVVAIAASRAMLETHASRGEGTAHFAWPRGTLLLVGVLVFAGMTAEGILYDWSVLYLKQDVGMPQSTAALGYGVFCGAMALARFGGDALRARYSERAVLAVGAAIAAAAMSGVLLAANAWVAFAGLALVGAGLAPIAPILFNAATRVPGVSRAAAIASVTTIGYSGFIVGPPLIGSIATASSLPVALWVVVLAAALVAWGARFVPERGSHGSRKVP